MYIVFGIYISLVILAMIILAIYEEKEERRYNKWLQENRKRRD